MDNVGAGGFGQVWKGRWKSKNKIVAIKKVMDLEEREVCLYTPIKILGQGGTPHLRGKGFIDSACINTLTIMLRGSEDKPVGKKLNSLMNSLRVLLQPVCWQESLGS